MCTIRSCKHIFTSMCYSKAAYCLAGQVEFLASHVFTFSSLSGIPAGWSSQLCALHNVIRTLSFQRRRQVVPASITFRPKFQFELKKRCCIFGDKAKQCCTSYHEFAVDPLKLRVQPFAESPYRDAICRWKESFDSVVYVVVEIGLTLRLSQCVRDL